MAKYTVAKNVDDHMDVISSFKVNIPRNRDSWNPPEGYKVENCSYHHSRKGNNHGESAPRVGAVEKHLDGKTWRSIAKARSQWCFNGKGRNYKVYSNILWAEVEDE